jgi:hypothetical protein
MSLGRAIIQRFVTRQSCGAVKSCRWTTGPQKWLKTTTPLGSHRSAAAATPNSCG